MPTFEIEGVEVSKPTFLSYTVLTGEDTEGDRQQAGELSGSFAEDGTPRSLYIKARIMGMNHRNAYTFAITDQSA